MADGGNLPIGPGIWGFIAFFVLAVALWLLVRNMNSRLRRMAYRDRDRAETEATSGEGGAPADADRVHAPRPEGEDVTEPQDAAVPEGRDPEER